MKDEKEAPDDLRSRTKRFGVSVIKLFVMLPKTEEARVLGRQLLRSGTSVGAQYREACRARSDAEFVSKLESALQELDETAYWCEMLIESRICQLQQIHELLQEADELTRIFVSIVKKRKCG
jgi:four helix bundle protein